MFNIIKISGLYMGIIIGAGFASGQEILNFFINYGNNWIVGMVLSGVIFATIGACSIKIIYDNNITNSYLFFSKISNKYIAFLLDIISAIFTCVLFCAMSSASGALIIERFSIHRFYGALIVIIFCFVIFCFGADLIGIINSILSPIILIISIYIFFNIYFFNDISVFLHGTYDIYKNKWLLPSILYSSYNIITGISSLISAKDIILKHKNTYIGGIIGGICMCIVGILTGLILFSYKNDLLNLELPLFYIVQNHSNFVQKLYFIMIISAIISTALGNGYAFICWLNSKLNVSKNLVSLFICLFAIFFSSFDFSIIVSNLYSFFGIFGILIIFYVIIYILRNY